MSERHGQDKAGKQQDLRIRRTRKALWNALIDLVVEKGLHAITITDITRRAMVNRSTFYAHYEDKEDLLEQGMAERLGELLEEMPPPPSHPETIDLNEPHPAAVRVFEHVREQERFYRALIVEGRLSPFLHQYEEQAAVHAGHRLKQIQDQLDPVVPAEALMYVTVGIQVSLIQWWLDHGLESSPEEMAIYLARSVTLGVYRCLGMQVPAEPRGRGRRRHNR